MRAQEVIKASIEERGPKVVAASLGVSLSLIYKWTEGKTQNPLDRALDLMKATGSNAQIAWLCTQLGGSFLPRPPASGITNDAQLVTETQRMLKEFSDVLSAMMGALADGHVSADEAALIRREWEELVPIAEGLVRACEAHAKDAKKR